MFKIKHVKQLERVRPRLGSTKVNYCLLNSLPVLWNPIDRRILKKKSDLKVNLKKETANQAYFCKACAGSHSCLGSQAGLEHHVSVSYWWANHLLSNGQLTLTSEKCKSRILASKSWSICLSCESLQFYAQNFMVSWTPPGIIPGIIPEYLQSTSGCNPRSPPPLRKE